MGEMGGISDTDSDETMIEGSVAESDLEEEELRIKRLSLIGKDMASTTDNNIATEIKDINGELSPEIQLICENSTYKETLKHPDQIILLCSEDEKKESQSLLQVGITCPVISSDICQSDFPPATTVHREGSLDSEITGFLETSEKNILNGDDFSKADTVGVGRGSVPRCIEMSDVFRSIAMINKEDMIENDPFPETVASDITKDGIMAKRSEVKDVTESLCGFDSQMMSLVVDMLEYQNDAHNMDASINEESSALPVELLTALNSLSDSVAGSVVQAVEKESVYRSGKEQMILDQTDDCTQITDTNFKPKFHLEQHEETEVSMITKLCHSEQEFDSNQHSNKLVHSDHRSIMSYDRLAEKDDFILSETSSSEQTIQVTSHMLRKSSRKRRFITSDGVYATLNSHRFLERSHQKKQSYKAQTRLSAKNSEACESGLKDKGDPYSQLRIASYHGSLSDTNGRGEQMRRSQRIAHKSRKQTTSKNYFNDSSFNYISLSSINRRDIFGQTLLHRAVIKDDLDHICAVIKAGANVNAQDYAGWTALHEASLAGFFEATNELLKAGADVNCKGHEQVTPLHDAVKEGHYKAKSLATTSLKVYLAAISACHDQVEGRTVFSHLTSKKFLKGMFIFHPPVAPPVPQWSLSLVLSQLILKPFEPLATCPLEFLSWKVAELLLWYGADPLFKHEKGKCALEEATGKQMRKLLESYIAKSSRRSVSDSSHSKEKEMLFSSQQLNTKAARINKTNSKGETCLHLAAKKGNLSLMKSLIASGACVNQRDNAGWTAIHEASIGGFVEIISELLKAGAEVNSKSLDGVLPIHDAVSGNHFEAVQFLLDHGANPNETNNRGKNAMDEATCDKMKELLESYGATGSKKTRMNDVAGELRPSRSRRTHHCYDCYGKDSLFAHSTATRQKCRTHESICKLLQDIEKKQNKLLLFELRSQRDADLYIQDLSQIQSILNEVLAKQKSERDDLAKKYRASVKSFEHGALREQLIKLVSRQKSLLLMAQKQKELGQKIQNYKKAKKDFVSSVKQTPSMSSSCERNNTQDGTSDETPQCPDVAMGIESRLIVESSLLHQEHNQYCNDSLHGENGRVAGQNVVDPHNEVSQKRLKECAIDKISCSKFSSALDQGTLPSEPAIWLTHTKPSQLEETDCEPVVAQRNTHPAAIPMTCTLNISEGRNIDVNYISQPTAFVCINETLQQHSNINEAYPTQTIIHLESTYSCLATPQKNISPNNRTSLNANLEFTEIVYDTQSPSRNSQDSSKCSTNQDSENQLNFKRNRRKKNQLLDLLEQEKIKPGNDVLEFTLQESKYKASLLGNGKLKMGNNTIYENPVQWIKALLGNDIPVNWKYVWNKVTYCGILLSKIVDEVHISKESLQQQKPFEPPHPPSSSKQLRFLPLNEIVLIEDAELLPQHIMDQYWNLYIHYDNFGF